MSVSTIDPLELPNDTLLSEVCLVPLVSNFCLGLSIALVGVIDEQVRSLAKELVEESLEIAERARGAEVVSRDADRASANSRAMRPLAGAGGGFSSIGIMYDIMMSLIECSTAAPQSTLSY